MTKKLLLAIPAAALVMFSGCATIISGSTQKVNVASTPSHIDVTLGDKTVSTPAIVELKRGEDLVLTSPECDNQTIVAKKINPVFFGNVVSGGVFGSTTDYSTGAMWKYDDNVKLECSK